ncbi:ATP synthase F1 subunit gamma [Patescibacteria group bacterium]|nr:ATP synthase F1 subunit gamma [Patescibacteria group bacterium]
MSGTKGIQARIKSVKNTKKVTKAMEMVAAAKMRRAIDAVLKTRTYASLSWEIVLRLSQAVNNEHPLLTKIITTGKQKKDVPSSKIAVILFTSNRGLCGGFNSNIINELYKTIKNTVKSENVDLILVGKKGVTAHNHYKYNIEAEFVKPDIASGVDDVVPIVKLVIKDYLAGKYSKIIIAYTDYINATKQMPRVKQLLPVNVNKEDEYLGTVDVGENNASSHSVIEEKPKKKLNDSNEYIFEPSPHEVLDEMVPRLIEVQIFQALLESNASEHSARMTAMHQATDAASDMIDELTLTYNKVRQAGITAEIAEIGAGVNAMN